MGIKKLDTIWLDGALVPWDSATDHLLAHTMHYGVGAFEGIRAYQRGDGRTAIFRLREHIERLLDSATISAALAVYSSTSTTTRRVLCFRCNDSQNLVVEILIKPSEASK
jgi:branched-chain amino acid aminotransferase